MPNPDTYAGASRARGTICVPLAAARRLPADIPHRLTVLSYTITRTLPNGSQPRTYSYAPLRLAGSFVFEAHILRGNGTGFWLELPTLVFDSERGAWVKMEYRPRLIGTICAAIERRHLREQARRYTSVGAGRN